MGNKTSSKNREMYKICLVSRWSKENVSNLQVPLEIFTLISQYIQYFPFDMYNSKLLISHWDNDKQCQILKLKKPHGGSIVVYNSF